MEQKKRITVITLIPRSGRFYAGQLKELFGDLAEVAYFSTGDRSVDRICPADLYLVSTDAFETAEDAGKYIPPQAQVVEIQLTYFRRVIQTLKEIPKGTKVLFVNVTRQMAREAVTQLEQLGVTQLYFVPFGADGTEDPGWRNEKISIAVTPDEPSFVPDGIEKVINIGHRPCAPATMIEAALRLGHEEILEGKAFQSYMRSAAAENYSFEHIFDRSRRLESRYELLIEILDEGMIGVNEHGEVIACNQKAADITGKTPEQAIGRPAEIVFPYIPFEVCLRYQKKELPRLIRIGSANINLSVVPVIRAGECLGAFASLQRFNELEKRQNELRGQLLRKGYLAKYHFEDVVGKSKAIEQTREILRKMANAESPVLLIGETGTGKELFAHAVHLASRRRDGPFVAINVAAMPENLLESELFGYEEGAFTGAKKGGRPGLFEFAHHGTLFLDEVEGMSPALQVKLLRVLQEREIMRVGGTSIIPIDVRIVAATNESLERKVAEGTFRRDLYYRLSTLPIVIPPLSERGDDLFLILEQFQKELGGSFRLTPQVRGFLKSYSWPGNIRELRNVVEYFLYTGHDPITMEDLPPTVFHRAPQAPIRQLPETPQQPSSDVFRFVLEQLYQASEARQPIGRERLLQLARDAFVPTSQQEIRSILAQMADQGLVRVSRGRGGSQLTPEGRQLYETGRI